jgi:hypothetical protein
MKEKQNSASSESYMEQARSITNKWKIDRKDLNDEIPANLTFDSSNSRNRTAGSAVSIGSNLANSARQIVGSFNCSGLHERVGPLVSSDPQEKAHFSRERVPENTRRGRSQTKRTNAHHF